MNLICNVFIISYIFFFWGPFLPMAKTGLSAVPLSLHTLLCKVRLWRCYNPLSVQARRRESFSFNSLYSVHLFQISTIAPAYCSCSDCPSVPVFSTGLYFNFYPVTVYPVDIFCFSKFKDFYFCTG